MNVFILGTNEAIENVNAAEIDLKDAGYMPVNPIKFINSIHGITEDQMVEVGYALLDMCEAVYFAIGTWSNYPVLNQYVGYARAKGMAFYEPETLPYASYSEIQKGTEITE